MMKFKLIQKGNPLKPADPKKWYAQPVYGSKVNQKELSQMITDKSSLTKGDIANVIENLLEELPKVLLQWGIVQLWEFGSFKVTLSSKGVAEKGQFSTEGISPKISFLPWVVLKRELEKLNYQQES